MKNKIFITLLLLIFFSSYFFYSQDNNITNENYKKALELLEKAKTEYENGDYDKSFAYSEEAKKIINEEKSKLEDKKDDVLTKRSIDIIENDNTDDYEKLVEDVMAKMDQTDQLFFNIYNLKLDLDEENMALLRSTENLAREAEDYVISQEETDDLTAKTEYLQNAQMLYDEAIDNLFIINDRIEMEITEIYTQIIECDYYRLELLNKNLIKENDENDIKILNMTEELQKSYSSENYNDAKILLSEIVQYIDYIKNNTEIVKINENEVLYKINEIELSINFFKEYDKENKYEKELEKADNILLDAKSAFDESDYELAIKKVYEIKSILFEFVFYEIEVGDKKENKNKEIFPKYYKVGNYLDNADCLWKISQYEFIYNDPLKWYIIYEANKDRLTIEEDPNKILAWKIIEIPSLNGEERSGIYDPNKTYPVFDPDKDYTKND